MSAAWCDNRAEYYSERGEDCPPRLDDIFDFLDKKNNEEYAYIWTVNNKWVAFDMNEFNDKDPEKVERFDMNEFNDKDPERLRFPKEHLLADG